MKSFLRIRSLRIKLLLGSFTLSMLLALSFMGAVTWLHHQQQLQAANSVLLGALRIIDDTLSDRREHLQAAAQQLAMQKQLGTTLWYLQQYAKSDAEPETLVNTYRQLLQDIYRIGHIAQVSKIALYDVDGKLITFGLFDKKQVHLGFAQNGSGIAKSIILNEGEEWDRQSLQAQPMPAGVDLNFGNTPTRDTPHFVETDGSLAIKTVQPVMGLVFDAATRTQVIRTVAWVVLLQPLDQAFVDYIDRLTQLKVNVFSLHGLISGGLPDYQYPDWSLVSATANIQTSAIAFSELKIGRDSYYYQGLIPVYADRQLIGAIAILYSMAIVQENTRSMIEALAVITFASLAFILPFTWYFAHSISRPLMMLSRIFHNIADGQRIKPISDEYAFMAKACKRADELGTLTQSFIVMDEAIRQKIEQIEQINTSLEYRIRERTLQLERMAHYDALTNIPNRVLLEDRMQQAILQAKREGRLLGICYLDLDGFKEVNDSLGHQAGDAVLIEITRRISRTIRGVDTAARMGGDEFVVLLQGLKDAGECKMTLKRLLGAIAEPLPIQGRSFYLSASIGATLYPLDNNEANILLRHADQAMYIAKQSGKNRYRLFDGIG